MNDRLSQTELQALIERVFAPGDMERGVAVLIDLPDEVVADKPAWAARRAMAFDWVKMLKAAGEPRYGNVSAILMRNAHTNNGELPQNGWIFEGNCVPDHVCELDPSKAVSFESLFQSHSIFLCPTQFSATAPLKGLSKTYDFRAATMGGFNAAMIPAMRLDYGAINQRVDVLKALLDDATGADIRFSSPHGVSALHLDLRHRSAHASGGLLRNNGMAGNLPSGEAYIVPNEGEITPSTSKGDLPVQFGDEVVLYRIEANKAVEIVSQGPKSTEEATLIAREPAYANIAELGLGVLAAFGIKPIGVVLLDEKLGLHIAFGRSEHFGGQVGPQHFSSPEAVIHIDRVYIPETQPLVKPESVGLIMTDGSRKPLMLGGDYVIF